MYVGTNLKVNNNLIKSCNNTFCYDSKELIKGIWEIKIDKMHFNCSSCQLKIGDDIEFKGENELFFLGMCTVVGVGQNNNECYFSGKFKE
jgi:hypothetical protein